MKYFLAGLIAATMLFFVAGCSVNPSELDDKYAQGFANKMKYAKDNKTGLCFAMVASRKTGYFNSTGLGVTMVPCEAVEHLLVK